MPTNRITFLVVEDNELDIEKISRGLARLKITNPVVTARDGIEALEVMRGTATASALKAPYLVLLDINMPRMNGFEFLAEVRADPALSSTPVYVLTTSDRAADVDSAYEHNVAGYIVKPIDRDGMLSALSKLDAYWELTEHPTMGAQPSQVSV